VDDPERFADVMAALVAKQTADAERAEAQRPKTPVEILEANAVLRIAQVAVVLGHVTKRGEPRRDVIYRLIKDGALRPVDPDQPITRLTVSRAEVQRYLHDGPRRGPDRVPWPR
jgi:hypothetical protein